MSIRMFRLKGTMPVIYTKSFDGKTFSQIGEADTKREALALAGKVRKKGNLARVDRTKFVWRIWGRAQ